VVEAAAARGILMKPSSEIKLKYARSLVDETHTIYVTFPTIVSTQSSEVRKMLADACELLTKAMLLISLGGHLPDMHYEEAQAIWKQLKDSGFDLESLALRDIRHGPPREDICHLHPDCLVIGSAHVAVSPVRIAAHKAGMGI
jgi:hypothetical protein